MSKVRGEMLRVMERAGVGKDGDVDVRRDIRRQRNAELGDQLEHHFAAGGRGPIEPVQRAVIRVAEMVIDVDDEAALEPVDARAREIAALHHDDGVAGIVDSARPPRCARHRETPSSERAR